MTTWFVHPATNVDDYLPEREDLAAADY